MLRVGSLNLERFADSRVARLDRGVDKITALFVWQKSALHRINRDLLKVCQRQAKCVSGGFEFFGHRGVAH